MDPIEISPIVIGLIGMGILFLLLAMGMPVGFAMFITGFVGFAYLTSTGSALTKLAIVPFRTISSYHLAVIPLFIFMAHICFSAGLSRDLYELAYRWMGRLPGGLAIATIGACAVFAAVSASSVATAVTMGLVALPEMKKYNYDPKLATGAVAAGGTMGSMIPPSAGLILYGIIAEVSIGRLFMAGVIPGLIEAVFYTILILMLCKFNPKLGPRGPSFSFKEKLAPIGRCGEIMALIALVLGGLFVGWFTPTEAGAVGAFGAIAFSMVRKRLSWQRFKAASLETAKTSGMIYAMLIGAMTMNYFLAVSRIPTELAGFVSGLPLTPLGVMAIIMVVYFVLGCFISSLAIILLTIPIFLPLVLHLGFDPIWFGIMITLMGEIAKITPPVGINVYAIAGVAKDVPMETIFKGIMPFVVVDMFRAALLLFVPQLALFLPGLMK
ncbi:TRAP transporter large permease [Chloroflexota bacterium]